MYLTGKGRVVFPLYFHFAVIDLEQREDAAKNEKENEEMATKNLQAEVLLVMMMTMMILYLLEIETMNLFYITKSMM